MIKMFGAIVIGVIAIIIWQYRVKYDPDVQKLKYQKQLNDKMREWHETCAKLDKDKIGSVDYERDYANSQWLSKAIRELNKLLGKSSSS